MAARYSIGDVACIKGVMEGIGAATTEQRAANWNNPRTITDDQIKNLKTALRMKPSDKIRVKETCELNMYMVVFTTTKEAYTGSGGADITVRYNLESNTASFTESWAWA